MEIKTLTSDFKLTGIIDNVRELSYTECFRDAGSFNMTIPFDKSLYESLKPPCRILVEELIFNVDKIVATDDEIRVTGSGIFSEFKHFYVSMPEELNASPADILYHFAAGASFDNVSYGVYGIAVEDTRVSESYEWCRDYYSIITQLCYDYELGFRIVYSFDENELKFHILSVRDRATASAEALTLLSDRRDSYSKLECVYDVTDYKNYLELIFRINSLDELVSYVYNDCPEGESVRGYTEYPHIIANTESELRKSFDSYAKRLFKQYRKRRYFKATLLGAPQHRIGDLCYVESTAMGEQQYALLTERVIEFIDTHRVEVLLLEVQ